MKVADFVQLRKLMMMTTSASDNEALTAIRKANEVVRRSGVTWEDVFARLVTVEPGVEAAPAESGGDPDAGPSAAYLAELLEEASEGAHGSWLDFVSSLSEQFEATGRLSRGQVEALERSRDRRRREAQTLRRRGS